MPYPTIPGRKFEYDIAGGSVYYGTTIGDVTTALTTEQMFRLNGTGNTQAVFEKQDVFTKIEVTFWIFLPEKYTVSGIGLMHFMGYTDNNSIKEGSLITIYGSPDSTNGLDGTWLKATLLNGNIPFRIMDDDSWRDSIQACTFTEPVKVVRINYYMPSVNSWAATRVYTIHIYGNKAEGEVPDDILFLDDDEEGDPEFVRDLDFGDRPEGTTLTHRIKLFNSSTTKIANNLSLSLIDTDYTFSMDEGATWVTGASITSLAPQGKSSSIIIKNTVPPPTQMLGPRAPRFEVIIGSWS